MSNKTKSKPTIAEALAVIAELDEAARQFVAKRLEADEKTLARLARIGDWCTLEHLARNPSVSIETLVSMSRDDDRPFVLQGVAENPRTPVDVVVRLSRHVDESVRSRAAENPNLPAKDLARLAKDRAFAVRAAVARNPSARPQLLMRLSADADGYVRHFAKDRLAENNAHAKAGER